MNMEEQQQMPPVGEPKKKRTGLIIFIVILAIAILIGGYFLTQYLLNKKVENVIDSGISQIELSSECRSIELQAQVTEISSAQYEITLTNNVDKNIGVKIILMNSLTNSQSEVLDFGSFLSAETKTNTLDLTEEVANANKIELVPYFLINGEESICPLTTSINL